MDKPTRGQVAVAGQSQEKEALQSWEKILKKNPKFLMIFHSDLSGITILCVQTE